MLDFVLKRQIENTKRNYDNVEDPNDVNNNSVGENLTEDQSQGNQQLRNELTLHIRDGDKVMS